MNKPIISFIIILLSLGFTFFYVMPAYNLNQERRGDIESLSNILSTSGEIKTLISDTKITLSSIEPSELADFEVLLPERVDPLRFANNIQYIGRKNRLVLSDIKVEEAINGSQMGGNTGGVSVAKGIANTISLGAKIDQAGGTSGQGSSEGGASSGKKYQTTKASFTFSANFETFQLFMNDIEKSLGIIDITTLSFSPLPEDPTQKKSKTPSSPMYQYSMVIQTYSLK